MAGTRGCGRGRRAACATRRSFRPERRAAPVAAFPDAVAAWDQQVRAVAAGCPRGGSTWSPRRPWRARPGLRYLHAPRSTADPSSASAAECLPVQPILNGVPKVPRAGPTSRPPMEPGALSPPVSLGWHVPMTGATRTWIPYAGGSRPSRSTPIPFTWVETADEILAKAVPKPKPIPARDSNSRTRGQSTTSPRARQMCSCCGACGRSSSRSLALTRGS